MNNQDSLWNGLTMAEKSAVMREAVKGGIYTLGDIRKWYDEGGYASHVETSPINIYKGGGYKPSDSIKKRIAAYEGAAMTGAIDPLSGKYDKNDSFENEAMRFYAALPESIREKVLSNPELADNLYSYSYNVGAGNFKKRVVPALTKYYEGRGGIEEVTDSMWASGDAKLAGLRRRRNEEKEGVRNALGMTNTEIPIQPVDNTFVYNPLGPMGYRREPMPVMIPDENEYVKATYTEPVERERQDALKALELIRRIGAYKEQSDWMNKPEPEVYRSRFSVGAYGDGGSIHIDPSKKGTFTAAATKHGMGVQEFASKVLAHPENYSPAMRKKANFARNARKWKHALGGPLVDMALNIYDDGGNLEEIPPIVPFTQRKEVIITPDRDYNRYLNTLPDNQRFTPNNEYDSYFYWKLNGKPKDFKEAYAKRMFSYNPYDKSYHANSIAWGKDGVGYFMKPKDHSTVHMETDWFNKGLITEDSGWRRPETFLEWRGAKEFRDNFDLVDDPNRPNYFRYQPKKKALGGPLVDRVLNIYGDGGVKSSFVQSLEKQPEVLEDLQNFNQEQARAKQEESKRIRKIIEQRGKKMADMAFNNPEEFKKQQALKGAAQHALWEKEHPVATQWGNVLGAVPFAVASYPLVATAGSGIVTLGDAAAATSAGQGITNFLAPIATTSYAGATVPQWFDLGLTSGFGAHGIQTAVDEKGISPTTALELAPLALPYGNFTKGVNEVTNYIGSKVPTPIKDAWNNRAEILAQTIGTEGKTWAKTTDYRGKEGIVFLNNNDVWKRTADWVLHPQQTYRARSQGFYPMTRKEWKDYLSKERDAMDFAKQKSIELNDAQLQQRLSLQPETFLDNRRRNANATIKIVNNPNNVFSLPRAPRNASEVANNVKVISRNKDVSYGGKWFDPKFGTGTVAVSHPDKNIIVLPRHNQTKFSNMLMTMPSRGYTSPIDTRMHTYVHELQHQMQQNLPLLNLSQWDSATHYYIPYDHFLRNIDSEDLLQPFKDNIGDPKRYWYASPNEYNAESNAYRVVDDFNGRRGILDPLDNRNAYRANIFGLNFDQTESLWNMGYKNGGNLRL